MLYTRPFHTWHLAAKTLFFILPDLFYLYFPRLPPSRSCSFPPSSLKFTTNLDRQSLSASSFPSGRDPSLFPITCRSYDRVTRSTILLATIFSTCILSIYGFLLYSFPPEPPLY
ncbi:hypothetical protein EsH8_II_000471 [Colletotrichum jinshuiense]